MNIVEAGGIPEVFLTSKLLLDLASNIKDIIPNSNILVHGCGSGVGTTLIQMISKIYNSNSYGICGSEQKANFCKNLGAINIFLRNENYYNSIIDIEKLKKMHGIEYDIILDHTGKSEFLNNLNLLKKDGVLVNYGLISGFKVDNLDLRIPMEKRLNIVFTTLLSRSNEFKSNLVNNFTKTVLPYLENKEIKVIVDKILPYSAESLDYAHNLLKENKNIGKIIIKH